MGKQDALESALWAAIVALEERADLSRRLLHRVRASTKARVIERYRRDIDLIEMRVALLKDLAEGLRVPVEEAHADTLAEDGHGDV
jgi:2-phosphoglycerate kinase